MRANLAGAGDVLEEPFALIYPDGTVVGTYGSRMEADADRIRRGGAGSVRNLSQPGL